MSKFIKNMICILSICSLFLVGCNNNVSKNEAQTNTNSKIEISQSDIENSSDNINKEDIVPYEDEIEIDLLNDDYNKDEYNTESIKQIYLNKLNQLDENLKETHDKRYASPVTLDLINAANDEYKQWDDILNEIYSLLEEQLSQEDLDKLRAEEIEWINIKELKSKEAADEYKGGTIAPYMAISSSIDSTRKRCYELVNQYMK